MDQITQPQTIGTEGGRRPTGVPIEAASPSSPEVVARPKRRRHTLAYKLKVLETVAALQAQGHGAVGAYLRKEGLYYSSVRTWERLQAEGKLTISRPGTKLNGRQELLAENKRLRRKQEQLEKRLKRAELIIELQKKLSQAMEQASSQENDER
jgi:hypothetical protein